MRGQQASAASTGGASVFVNTKEFKKRRGHERRRYKRIPKSIGILVEPLDENLVSLDRSFFAITRDISKGGLGFLSPFQSNFEQVLISREDDQSRAVVCRVCNSCLIHASELEHVYLTSVEFLFERFA